MLIILDQDRALGFAYIRIFNLRRLMNAQYWIKIKVNCVWLVEPENDFDLNFSLGQ